jgi:hypothetical protein
MRGERESSHSARAYERIEPGSGNQLLRPIVTLHCIIFQHRATANWPLVDDVERRVIIILLERGHRGVTEWDTCHTIANPIPGLCTTSPVWTELAH